MDFKPAHDAKLGPTDLARLLDVSRVAASGWLNGHTDPHNLLTQRVSRLLDKIGRAVSAGELPAPSSVRRAERAMYIRKVLAKF
jgi:hypothetical protein